MGERERIRARIRAFRRKLAGVKRLMSRIGKIVVDTCKEAFFLQRLGELEWPARYDGKIQPFINIAGALHDFIEGSSAPKKVQFLDRPALLTTGALRRSIAAKVIDDTTVSVGTPVSYAHLHQEGGRSVQTYDDTVQDRIRAWLYGKKGAIRKGRGGYESALAPLLEKHFLRTEAMARPFIGVTPEAETRTADEIRSYFAGRR